MAPEVPELPSAPLVLLWISPFESTTRKLVKVASVSIVAIFTLPPTSSLTVGSAPNPKSPVDVRKKSFCPYLPPDILLSAFTDKIGKPAAELTVSSSSLKSSSTENKTPLLPTISRGVPVV